MKINEEQKIIKVTASKDPTRWMQDNFAFDEMPKDSPFVDEMPEEEIIVDFEEGKK